MNVPTRVMHRMLPLLLVLGAASPARAQPAPAPGTVLNRPSLRQLRPLVGRVVRIKLTDGKQVQARLVSAWPGVLRVQFVDGRTGAVARNRVLAVTYVSPRFTPLATRDAADSGRLLMYLGLGLTVGGAVLGGAAAPPLYLYGAKQECPGTLGCVPPATTAAIFITALSASAMVAGIPLWVAGVVRQKVHGRTGAAARRARRLYRSWGIGLTLTGTGIAVAGGGLLIASVADFPASETVRWAGLATACFGALIAVGVGLPMWVEAVRQSRSEAPATADLRNPLHDPHHRRAWQRQYRSGPGPVAMTYGWRF